MPDQGRKHVKSRYGIKCQPSHLQYQLLIDFLIAVELDLRLPSMLHGKKGFDRIIHAFKTVLNHALTWLFVDLGHSDSNAGSHVPTFEFCSGHSNSIGPISQHHPTLFTVKPEITKMPGIIVPINNSKDAISDPTYEEQLLEWFGMVNLDSPRIRPDTIDRYLCRYDLPEAFEPEGMSEAETQNLVRLRWRGFAPSTFILAMWLIPKAALEEHWFALSASTFQDASYSILCSGGRSVLLWECG
jgi:ribonuclease P/MRP protein subunit RPP40